MKILLTIVLIAFCLTSQAQKKIYLQNTRDTSKYRLLPLKKYYKIISVRSISEKVWLSSFTDSTLVFFAKKGKGNTIVYRIADIEFIDRTPVIFRQFAYMGALVFGGSLVVFVATPFIGIFEGWEKGREALEAGGFFAGVGFALASPTLLFKSYDMKKNWRIVIK